MPDQDPPVVTDPPDPPDPKDPPEPRTFSQDDVDRIVRDRLARQKTQFSDYDDLKTQATRLKEIEDAQKSELERERERATELERKANEAEAARAEALYESAVIAEAATKNVTDPKDVVRLINRAEVTFGSDGAPTNISDVVDSLLKAKPYLAGGGAGQVDQGARGGSVQPDQLSRDDLKTMSPDEIVKARKEGRLANAMSGQ